MRVSRPGGCAAQTSTLDFLAHAMSALSRRPELPPYAVLSGPVYTFSAEPEFGNLRSRGSTRGAAASPRSPPRPIRASPRRLRVRSASLRVASAYDPHLSASPPCTIRGAASSSPALSRTSAGYPRGTRGGAVTRPRTYPRGSRGGAATRPRAIHVSPAAASSRLLGETPPSSRTIHVVAAVSPRRVSSECQRLSPPWAPPPRGASEPRRRVSTRFDVAFRRGRRA